MTGSDGHEIIVEGVKGTYGRGVRSVRCRPGDMLWKYRKGHYEEAQYQGGMALMALWELAGAGSAKSVEWDKVAAPGGSYGGLSAATCDAITRLRYAYHALGQAVTKRLYDHVVSNMTVSEIAAKWRFKERQMADILYADLRAAADLFGLQEENERAA